VILAITGLVGAFLTGLYTFRLYFIVFGPGEARAEHHGEGPSTMLLPVGVLSVLAIVGGWIQFAPVWTPVTDWLHPAAATLGVAEPTNTQEAIASILAVALGLAGIAVAYLMYARRSVAVPSRPRLQRALEHKLYFDEAYDALFFRPAAGMARLLRDGFEVPWFISTPTELGEDTLTVARGVRRIQTGLLRTYVLFLGTGMAVLAVVLLVVK
jgi:NADH-quinone oxidoreductase subunit L